MSLGTLVIQIATVGQKEALAEARLLSAQGVRFIDAQASGSIGPAAAGEPVILCGGAAEDVQVAVPVLEHLGHPRHLGPVGSANAAKIVINHLLGVTVAALAEAYSLGQHLGIDSQPLADLLQDMPTLSPAMRAKLGVMRSAGYTLSFYLELVQKDMALVQASLNDFLLRPRQRSFTRGQGRILTGRTTAMQPRRSVKCTMLHAPHYKKCARW
ncbi:MAG: NAD-binding protein [Thermaerobacter sp.]|nr:NAD-binding protein [Thermaerobacter sp.]